jgi:mannose-6-phosphate isomerase
MQTEESHPVSNKVVQKPWGREVWLEVNDRYCYKRIYINQSHRTSLQFHRQKLETNYVVSGRAEIWLEDESGTIQKYEAGAGAVITVQPGRKHRVVALSDVILQEVSTPEVDDVVRVQDDTLRGDGRIESEHGA